MKRFVITTCSLLVFLLSCTNLSATEQIFKCERIYIKSDKTSAEDEGNFSAQYINSNSTEWQPFCEFFGIDAAPTKSKHNISCNQEMRVKTKFDKSLIIEKAKKYSCEKKYNRCDFIIDQQSKKAMIQYESIDDIPVLEFNEDITDTGLRSNETPTISFDYENKYCVDYDDGPLEELKPYRRDAFDQLECYFHGPEINVFALKKKYNDGDWQVKNFPDFYPCVQNSVSFPTWRDTEYCSPEYQELIMGRITADYTSMYGEKENISFDSQIRKLSKVVYHYDQLYDEFVIANNLSSNETCEIFN